MKKLSTKDYELAQDFLNDILNRNEENISELSVTAKDLERVRGLIQKKLSDLKSVIVGAEKYLNVFEYDKYEDWRFISCLIILKGFDLSIMESFEIWTKYQKLEKEFKADIHKIIDT